MRKIAAEIACQITKSVELSGVFAPDPPLGALPLDCAGTSATSRNILDRQLSSALGALSVLLYGLCMCFIGK